jgi:hypothetical protein
MTAPEPPGAVPEPPNYDYCRVCTCWIWEALGWLLPNHRCADLGLAGDDVDIQRDLA